MRRRSALSPAPIEFLPRRFYLVVVREQTTCSIRRAKDKSCDESTLSERFLFPRTPGIHFVSLREQLLPSPTGSEFVLGIPQTIRFNSFLTGILSSPPSPPAVENASRRDHKAHYFFLRRRHLREEIQAIHLICRWRLLCLQLPPHEALAPFEHLPYLFSSFVSSSTSFDPPNLMVSLAGLAKGREKELLDSIGTARSSSSNWEVTAANCELEPNLWAISQRFIVYDGVSGRYADNDNRQNGTEVCVKNEDEFAKLEVVIATLKRRKVSLVVTLSKAASNSAYAACGLEILDISASTAPATALSLGDKYTPSGDTLVNRFLEACEATEGLIAVNASSGSGGVSAATCIGCYLMKHSNFTSQEAVGWLQFCLPVKVRTGWELFLAQMQSHMWLEGERFRRAGEGAFPDDIANSPTIDSTHINIGKISLGRVSLLGTRDRDRHRVNAQAASIPVSTCLSSRSQETQLSPTAATTTAQLKRRPLTQGSAGSRRYHRSTDGSSLRADFTLMHKFLHQTPAATSRSTSVSTAAHTVPSRPKVSPRSPDSTPSNCTEALA